MMRPRKTGSDHELRNAALAALVFVAIAIGAGSMTGGCQWWQVACLDRYRLLRRIHRGGISGDYFGNFDPLIAQIWGQEVLEAAQHCRSAVLVSKGSRPLVSVLLGSDVDGDYYDSYLGLGGVDYGSGGDSGGFDGGSGDDGI
jgi:hypothetical protein